MAETEYVLGTGEDELYRLKVQHEVWADFAIASWKRAGIQAGSHVLDVGSGPGHASFDLAELVTEKGRVCAVDESEPFVAYVNDQATRRKVPQLRAQIADAQSLGTTFQQGERFDAIYTRWVLCWLTKPEAALAGMRALLKPNGKLIIHDYFNWKSMTMAPRSAAIEKMVLAAVSSFEDRGGNVDFVGQLPAMLKNCGLKISHFDVHVKVPRGGNVDPDIAWPLTWWRLYGPKLVALGKLSPEDYAKAAADLDRLELDDDRFFYCPPVFEVVAELNSKSA